jgi:hypothetical protein
LAAAAGRSGRFEPGVRDAAFMTPGQMEPRVGARRGGQGRVDVTLAARRLLR